jgi:hypothetical protein
MPHWDWEELRDSMKSATSKLRPLFKVLMLNKASVPEKPQTPALTMS